MYCGQGGNDGSEVTVAYAVSMSSLFSVKMAACYSEGSRNWLSSLEKEKDDL